MARTTYTDTQGHYQLPRRPGQIQFGDTGYGSRPCTGYRCAQRAGDRSRPRGDEEALRPRIISRAWWSRRRRPATGRLPERWHFDGRFMEYTEPTDEGRFMVEQTPGETTLYAYVSEQAARRLRDLCRPTPKLREWSFRGPARSAAGSSTSDGKPPRETAAPGASGQTARTLRRPISPCRPS